MNKESASTELSPAELNAPVGLIVSLLFSSLLFIIRTLHFGTTVGVSCCDTTLPSHLIYLFVSF